MARKRFATLRIGLAALLLLTACGGGGMTLSEYATEIEQLVNDMNARLDRGTAALDEQPASVATIRFWADDRIEARDEFIAALEAMVPPEEAADLHEAASEAISALVSAEREMVERVHEIDDLPTLQQIWSSPSGQAARSADEKAVEICRAAQAAMDSTADRSAFVGVPWVPPELQEIVDVTFGCTPDERS